MGGLGGYKTPAIIFDLAGDTWTPQVNFMILDVPKINI